MNEPVLREPQKTDMTKSLLLRHVFRTLALACVSLYCVGCSTTGGLKTPDLSALKPAGPPTSAVAAWSYCVEHRDDGDPRRGFGGRVYFYDQDARRPVKIDGNVVVYAYDESVCSPDDPEPTRRHLFEKDEVKGAYVKSKLGHSYNFFVPWDSDTVNGESKKVSLIVRYVPKKGSSVMTQQTAVYMPGKPNQNEMMAKADWKDREEKGLIGQVGYRTEKDAKESQLKSRMLEGNENRPDSMATMTLSIPNNYSPAMQYALSTPAPQALPPSVSGGDIQQATFVREGEAAPARMKTGILPEDPRTTRLPQKVRNSLTDR